MDKNLEKKPKYFGKTAIKIIIDEAVPINEVHIKLGNKILAILEDEASKEDDE